MNLDVRWFLASAVETEVLSQDLARQLVEVCGGPDAVDLMIIAQGVLENNLCEDVSLVQTWMDHAHAQSQLGAPPDPAHDLYPDNTSILGSLHSQEAMEADAIEELAPVPERQAPPSVEAEIDYSDLDNLDLSDLDQMSDEKIAKIMSKVLVIARDMGASDLHISAQARPFARITRELHKFGEPLSEAVAEKLNTVLLNDEQRSKLQEAWDLDLALTVDESNRFRVNIMRHKQGLGGTYRLVPDHVPSLEELGFGRHASTVRKLLDFHYGLILVTGPVGSGKTTTLAAMIDILNTERTDHIISVEDPIEIVQTAKGCNVSQRQVGLHTKSFGSALKGALREDPDIIVIGELRDLETIENAITAAETGHLVIGTLHTSDAATTLHRILDVFPFDQQAQIRAMVAQSLRGVICQKMIPNLEGTLSLALEVLINNSAVSNNIADGATHQLHQVLQTGTKHGMCLLDVSILDLYLEGKIDADMAFYYLEEAECIKAVQMREAQEAKRRADEERKRNKKGWFRR